MYRDVIELIKKLVNGLESIELLTEDLKNEEWEDQKKLIKLAIDLEDWIRMHIMKYGSIANEKNELPDELRIFKERGWFD